MEKITQDNFKGKYTDPIKQRQIDKFACNGVSRQIHCYIKRTSDPKTMMEKSEAQLSTLSVPQKEEAIAWYIDLNRKVLSGLDSKIVLTRTIANYRDTFSYILELVNDKHEWMLYLSRIRSKYTQYYTVIERDGEFDLCDHCGNILIHLVYDSARTRHIYVGDLVTMPIIMQEEGKTGLILPDGEDTIVAPFEFDDVSSHEEYLCFEITRGGEQGSTHSDGQFTVMPPD